MSMEHKAYALDWDRFEAELLNTLTRALETNDARELVAYINANRAELTYPWEEEPLPEDWREQAEAEKVQEHVLAGFSAAEWQEGVDDRDVQRYGDFALTRFYRAGEDDGLAGDWMSLSEELSDEENAALLGRAVGPEGRWFDPGRMGSFFQPSDQVRQSLAVLAECEQEELAAFRALLGRCAAAGLGVYVTF